MDDCKTLAYGQFFFHTPQAQYFAAAGEIEIAGNSSPKECNSIRNQI